MNVKIVAHNKAMFTSELLGHLSGSSSSIKQKSASFARIRDRMMDTRTRRLMAVPDDHAANFPTIVLPNENRTITMGPTNMRGAAINPAFKASDVVPTVSEEKEKESKHYNQYIVRRTARINILLVGSGVPRKNLNKLTDTAAKNNKKKVVMYANTSAVIAL
jgi:hypothetical protein